MSTGNLLDNYIKIYLEQLSEEDRENVVNYELVMFADSALFDDILDQEEIKFNSDAILSSRIDILSVNSQRIDDSSPDSYDYYRSGESVHIRRNGIAIRIVRVGSRPSIIQMRSIKK